MTQRAGVVIFGPTTSPTTRDALIEAFRRPIAIEPPTTACTALVITRINNRLLPEALDDIRDGQPASRPADRCEPQQNAYQRELDLAAKIGIPD